LEIEEASVAFVSDHRVVLAAYVFVDPDEPHAPIVPADIDLEETRIDLDSIILQV